MSVVSHLRICSFCQNTVNGTCVCSYLIKVISVFVENYPSLSFLWWQSNILINEALWDCSGHLLTTKITFLLVEDTTVIKVSRSSKKSTINTKTATMRHPPPAVWWLSDWTSQPARVARSRSCGSDISALVVCWLVILSRIKTNNSLLEQAWSI